MSEQKAQEEVKDAFSLLDEKLQGLVRERFREPTPIQAEVIPSILEGKDTLVISETGSGKTESALLPLFNFLVKDKPKPVSILYITPLKSLNRDILKRILWWSNKLEFDVSVRHGDTPDYERKMQVENPPDLMIVTPETLQAVLTAKRMKENFSNIKFIVIDEVHELVSNKRGLQLSIGLERLKSLIKNSGGSVPRMVGLSATVGSPEEVMEYISPGKSEKSIINMGKMKKILVNVEFPGIKQGDGKTAARLFVGPQTAARLRRINDIIKARKSVLTFTNTREFAEVLSSRLKALDSEVPIETHHSSLSRPVRVEAEDRFKSEELKALVCTSSLELGIDIGSIDYVIQYMSPRQVAKFLQRIGRSGHSMDKTSEGTIIATDTDDCFEAASIASLALGGFVEKTFVYPYSWDVLAHQIIGMLIGDYSVHAEKAYNIVKGAYPYRDLQMKDFLMVCDFLNRLRLAWADESPEGLVIKRRKTAFDYYFGNLTTIPDSKNYRIINTITNTPVGTLDAEFIALHGSTGSTFICKGQPWRIIQTSDDRIFVEPVSGIEAAIPAWVGELIPVPYEVSQRVGEMRSLISSISGKPEAEVISRIASEYPVSRNVAKRMARIVKEQKKFGIVPDSNNVLAEYYSEGGEMWLVLHTLWGSLVNETIGRALSSILMSRSGSVGLQTDPYRIMLRMQSWDQEEAVKILKGMTPKEMESALREELPNNDMFKWRFMQVAQRFGIVKRDADYGKAYVRKIIEVYAGSPAYEEGMNEVLREKLDLEKAGEILGRIKSGEIKITLKPGLSPLGKLGLARKYEVIAPKTPDKEIANMFKERLLDTNIGLVCCNCGNVVADSSVKNIRKDISCKYCEAKLIGFVPHRHVHDAEKLMKKYLRQPEYVNMPKGKKAPKAKFTQQELRHIQMIMDSGALIISHGHDALKVLAGRGVGPKTAARILSRGYSEDELYNAILDAERNYIRTRVFWKR